MSEAEFITRPVIMGTHGMVTSDHYLATEVGLQVLKNGGNAVDAGASMWFCLTVLKPYLVGLAGEVPILLYWADEGKVLSINGQGPAPKAATIDWFGEHGYELIPEDGFLPAVVPGAFDAWVAALEKYGTLCLSEVMEPAIRLAEEGFPVYPLLNAAIAKIARRFRDEWLTSSEIYLPNGNIPKTGSLLRNPELARTLTKIAEAEKKERTQSRSAGLNAARDYFYRGPVAEAIISFTHSFRCKDVYGMSNCGLLEYEDFEEFKSEIEEPLTVNYRGYDIYKCGPWTQGPVLLQQLNLLEGYGLGKMGHNTVEYIHTWIECAKLAFADREQYYADPKFVEFPKALLSKEYAAERRKLISDQASMEFRPGWIPPKTLEETQGPRWDTHGFSSTGDTVHLEAMDQARNLLSATPSGGWIPSSPLIPGLGFPLGTRAQMFHLDPDNVEKLEPCKKPSTTLSPSLVMKKGSPFMTFGTPGADQQDQWTLQFFLNYVEFGMNIQKALDAPTVHSLHFPASFWPHDLHPGVVAAESRIDGDVLNELRKRGHKIVIDGAWSHGRCLAIQYNSETSVISGAASPRPSEAYALGW